MADIFISYSSRDRPRVRPLAEALSTCGWSVWWDPQIPAGRTFDQVIAAALASARCVVVVWSKESIASSWVREEAEEGRRREILIPVLIDESRPPLGFGRIQAVDLARWNGLSTADAFQKLVTDITSIVGPPQAHGPESPASPATERQAVAPAVTARDPDDQRRDSPVMRGADIQVAVPALSGSQRRTETAPVPPAEGSVRAHGSPWRRWEAIAWSLTAVLVLAVLAVGWYWPDTRDAGSSQPRATTSPSDEPGLRLNAVMNEGAELLTTGVRYTVYAAHKDPEGKRTLVVESRAHQEPPRFRLPAGRYYVTAEYGSASAGTGVEVPAAALVSQTLNLRAGILRLSSVLAPGSPPITTGVSYQVYEADKDQEGNRKLAVDSGAHEGPPRFPLPAGRYFVTAEYGSASATMEVEVTAAAHIVQTLNLRAGILALSSQLTRGSPPLATGVRYEVYEAAKDQEGTRKLVVDSGAHQGPPRFPLPAGRYYVTAEYGSASASTEIEVMAAAHTRETLNLRAGILALSSQLTRGGPPLTTGVNYEVYQAGADVEGKRTLVVRSGAHLGPPRFALPAGRYYVTAACDAGRGDAETVVAEGEVHQVPLRVSPAGQR